MNEFVDGHATRGMDSGSSGIVDVPAYRLQQHLNISNCTLSLMYTSLLLIICWIFA